MAFPVFASANFTRHFVPVNSQARFHLAYNLLIANRLFPLWLVEGV